MKVGSVGTKRIVSILARRLWAQPSALSWSVIGRRVVGVLVAVSALSTAIGVSFAAGSFVDASGNSPDAAASAPASYPLRFYQKYISDLRHGRCRFEPSCSQYAIDAIEAHGFLLGSSLATDRLIRCSRHADAHYARASSGRLSDPADGSGYMPGAPRVPDWLLPAREYSPLASSIGDPVGADSMAARTARILEDAEFADALSASGDCERAVTEYKRVAFMANTEDAARWSFFKIGDCYFGKGDWVASASAYGQAGRQATAASDKTIANYMAGAAYFNKGKYRRAIASTDLCTPENRQLYERVGADVGVTGGRHIDDGRTLSDAELEFSSVYLLKGLSALAMGEWQYGARHFAEATALCADSLCRERALFLAQRAAEGAALPTKHANLAACLSAVLPGSGQVYAGRAHDGFRHFVFNGLLIFTIYQLADDDLWGAAYLVAGITLPFYVGNIIGARRSAESYNASRRIGFVSESLKKVSQGDLW